MGGAAGLRTRKLGVTLYETSPVVSLVVSLGRQRGGLFFFAGPLTGGPVPGLAIAADAHGPRECRLICLRGALVATVQDRIAIGSAGMTGRQQTLVPALQQPGAIQHNHPFFAWLRRGLGHAVLHLVVRPERGLGDDWGNGLRAARDGADERDREPELHPILPPHLAIAFSWGRERTDPCRKTLQWIASRCVAIPPRRDHIAAAECSDSKPR